MLQRFSTLLLAASLAACNASNVTNMNQANALSREERSEGWQLLFDGATTNGWHTYGKSGIGKAWQVSDSSLHLNAASKKDWQTAEGGDIVSADTFEDFHLKLDWKIAPGGNSGVIFYVQEDTSKYPYPWMTGPEIQVLDNAAHADASIIKHRAGDLYDLISAKEVSKPAGQWNQMEVISNDGRLEFRMNGEKILETTMWDDNWRRMIAASKFKDMPGFGAFKSGKIALQDHGDNVWFRNIKIRRL